MRDRERVRHRRKEIRERVRQRKKASEKGKVREVKSYPNWVVRSFAGGPVWEEFKITNEEMHFMTPLGEYMKDEEEI